tara:strand:- start:1805 stop:2674 length:870 start_codon:yes stop_codon:yes gene_type:complete
MNINQALKNSYLKLKSSSKTYKLDCEILLSDILKIKNRFDLFLNLDKELTKNEISKFYKKISDRQKFKPISKIVRKKDFWKFEIDLPKNVLIPRPETETLLDLVFKVYKNKKNIQFLDVGCGSGCISLSLLDIILNSTGEAFDISKDAVLNTKLNLKKYNKHHRVKVFQKDLFKFRTNKKYDLIISNPPYLKSSDYINLCPSIKNYEPKNAYISDNKDGISFYNHIILSLKNNIKLNGYLAFEIGDNQFIKIQNLLRKNGFIIVSKIKLINDQIRCLLAKKIKNYALQQ